MRLRRQFACGRNDRRGATHVYHRVMTSAEVPTLLGLFASAFASATLLPGGSEAVLAIVVAHNPDIVLPAVGWATLGNTLGGLTSYAIGRVLPQPRATPRALGIARRFGVWALLLSWVPLIGDALCVASGWLRHNALAATAAIAIGKLARYLAVVAAVTGF
jgi:membrane protein YqaA with SNARE-associated domain